MKLILEGFEPKINKLGSTEWEKIKLKARNRAKDIADQLLKLYALREMQEGFAFSIILKLIYVSIRKGKQRCISEI